MVVSIDGARPRWPAADQRLEAEADDRRGWLRERGATRFAQRVDLLGAFPGFGRDGGARRGARLRLTDSFLLVDEGRSHGFALPHAAVRDTALLDRGTVEGWALLVRYEALGVAGAFLVRPCGSFFARSDRSLAELAAAFARVGVRLGPERRSPSLALDWAEARPFAGENVVWSGCASAPADLWGAGVAADVWLSTRSLMWAAATARSIHRLPLEAVAEAVAIDPEGRSPAPGVALAVAVDDGGTTPLVIRFDRHEVADRNRRERGAFLVGLRSRGIAIVPEPRPFRPWLGDAWDGRPSPPTDCRPATNDAPEAERVGVAEVAVVVEPDPALPVTGTVRGAVAPDATHPLRLVAGFEAGALAVLASIGGAGATRPPAPPAGMASNAALANALAELDGATAAGALSAEQAAAHRARLRVLHEAAVRLRSLAEVREAGFVTDAEFARKRAALLGPLADLLFPR